MKYFGIIIATVALVAIGVFAFAMPSKNPNTPDNEEELSSREKEVLQEVVKGLSNKEIADVLCISTHTVISHRKNIARKLNIHSVAGLTIYALVNGLTDLNNL